MTRPLRAPFPLLISIDVDGDLPLLAQHPDNVDRMKSRSNGRYGPENGAPRLLSVLDDLGLTADWFFPGEIARRYPTLIQAVHRAGHGIGVHGNEHVDFDRLGLEGQLDEMVSGRDAIREIIDVSPVGFRTPGGEWAPEFPEAMQEAGFKWSSSLPADEVPFLLAGTTLVEIPFRYELEDLQYLGYSYSPPFPPGQSRITPLELMEANWWCEVRGAERYATLLHLRLNAEIMGIPSRARLLQRFLTDVRNNTLARLTTCAELCARVATEEPDPEHPYALFQRLRAEPPGP